MWAVFMPQQEHGSHQHWERGQGDVGEWVRRLVSSPFSLSFCLSFPPHDAIQKAHNGWHLCPVRANTVIVYVLSGGEEEGQRCCEAGQSHAPPFPLSYSLFFSIFLFLSPSHFLFKFLRLCPNSSQGWSLYKAILLLFCHLHSLNLFVKTPKQFRSVEATILLEWRMVWCHWMWSNFVHCNDSNESESEFEFESQKASFHVQTSCRRIKWKYSLINK